MNEQSPVIALGPVKVWINGETSWKIPLAIMYRTHYDVQILVQTDTGIRWVPTWQIEQIQPISVKS